MMSNSKDEYIRDYSFDPEFILGRKDSLSVHKKQYERRKIMKKPRKRKLLIIPQEYINRKFNCNNNDNNSDRKHVANRRQNLIEDDDDDDKVENPQNQVDLHIEEFYQVSLDWCFSRHFFGMQVLIFFLKLFCSN
jgi:hypothetical protein